MDFHQLRVFVEVVRQKSFSRAAENIFLSQPTVSAHIKALEKEVGAPLLDRSQREVALTEAGKILFRYAQQLLGFKEEALATIQKKYSIIKGHLEIAASSVPGSYLLPAVLTAFSRKYTEVSFSVLIRDSKKVMESIRDYTIELGLVGETGTQEDLVLKQLVQDELILIAPPGTSLPPARPQQGVTGEDQLPLTELKACARLPFILREPGSATRLVFEKALKKAREEAHLHIVAFIEGQEAIKEAVKKGLGLTAISRRAVQYELKAGLLEGYRLKGLDLGRSFYLVFHKNRTLTPLSKVFLEFTEKFFRAQQEGP